MTDTSPEDETADRQVLSSSLVIGLAFGALAMLYSLVLFRFQLRAEHGLKLDVWYQPGDVWMLVDGGRFVWHGALGYVYENAGQSYALPTSYILMAPISALIDHFQLAEGLIPIPRASAWPLVATFILSFNIFVLDAVRRLAWDLGLRRRLWMVQIATVLVVCVPAFQFGHFEDVLALTFLLHGVRYLLQRRPLACCLLLSLAISFKQWAVLAIPLVIVLMPWGRRLIGLAVAAALPLLLTGIVVITDPVHGLANLFSPDSPKANAPGHVSFFVTWFGSKTSRATRTMSVMCSPIVALIFRSVRRTPAILAALSVLLLLRPLFEPILYAYYLMPSMLAAGLVGIAAHRSVRWRDWLPPTAAVLWALPHSNKSTSTMWWLVEVVLLVATWIGVAINCGVGEMAKELLRRSHSTSRIVEDATPESPIVSSISSSHT